MNLDINDADNAQVRTEVLRRIDLMPGVSQANKDRLYASVDHARRMGRVLTVPFEKGKTSCAAPMWIDSNNNSKPGGEAIAR